MTLAEFNKTIEIMRKAYPFADEDTLLVSTKNVVSCEQGHIELFTKDKETDTCITLERGYERSEERPWWEI